MCEQSTLDVLIVMSNFMAETIIYSKLQMFLTKMKKLKIYCAFECDGGAGSSTVRSCRGDDEMDTFFHH